MNPPELKDGAKIRHRYMEIEGVLVGRPRAHGTHAKAKLAGNISSSYYSRADLQLVAEDGSLHEFAVAPQLPSSPATQPPQTPIVAPEPPRDRIERAIAATIPKEAPRASGDVHQGDITLDYLLDQRRVIARDLAAFDERIAEVRVLAMLRRALAGVRIDGESGQRVGLSADALKIKHDTARALAAAERLAARGAL